MPVFFFTLHIISNTWVRSLALARTGTKFFVCIVQDRTSEPDKCGVHRRDIEYK
jgi:hypothetical protein